MWFIVEIQHYNNLDFIFLHSNRIVGKLEKWNANALTFYAEPNFIGANEKMLVEDDFGTEYLPFEPK